MTFDELRKYLESCHQDSLRMAQNFSQMAMHVSQMAKEEEDEDRRQEEMAQDYAEMQRLMERFQPKPRRGTMEPTEEA